MKECPNFETCKFYKEYLKKSPISQAMQKDYCNGDYSQCARLLVRNLLGKEKVPQDLFPTDKEEAIKIIKGS